MLLERECEEDISPGSRDSLKPLKAGDGADAGEIVLGDEALPIIADAGGVVTAVGWLALGRSSAAGICGLTSGSSLMIGLSSRIYAEMSILPGKGRSSIVTADELVARVSRATLALYAGLFACRSSDFSTASLISRGTSRDGTRRDSLS